LIPGLGTHLKSPFQFNIQAIVMLPEAVRNLLGSLQLAAWWRLRCEQSRNDQELAAWGRSDNRKAVITVPAE
jgi:hypothetical protein